MVRYLVLPMLTHTVNCKLYRFNDACDLGSYIDATLESKEFEREAGNDEHKNNYLSFISIHSEYAVNL